MGRKILLINSTVLATIAFLVQYLLSSWGAFEDQVVTRSNLATPAIELSKVPQAELVQPLPNFMLVPEKNLFTVERTSTSSQESVDDQVDRPKLAKWPDLLSVSMFAGTRQAELNVYTGGRGQRSEQHVVSIGDIVQGYLVSDIQDDRLVLAWEDFSHELTVSVATNKKKKAAAKQAVNIITIGAAGAAVETTTVASEESRGLEVSAVGDRRGRVGRESQDQAGGALNQGAGGLNNRSGLSPTTGGRAQRTVGSRGRPRRPLNR